MIEATNDDMSPEFYAYLMEKIFQAGAIRIRLYPVERRKLERSSLTIENRFGSVRVKVSKQGDVIKNIAPEY